MKIRIATALALFSLAQAVAAAEILTTHFDPSVVRLNRTEPVTLTIVMDAPVAKVKLEFKAIEGSLQLVPAGANVWQTKLSPAPLLAKYQNDDVGRLEVGLVLAFDAGGTQVDGSNVSLGVLDSAMGSVPMATLSSKQRLTRHVLNILCPATKNPGDVNEHKEIAKEGYTFLKDDYDFLNLAFAVPSFPMNRRHYAVRDIGTGFSGAPTIDGGADYGSPSRLIGITAFPSINFFDLAESGHTHELGHQWIQFTFIPIFGPEPHWAHSTMARDIMGTNASPNNAQGVNFQWDFEKQPDGSFKWIESPAAADTFNDLDLYLAGFLPAEKVTPQRVALDKTEPCAGCPVATKLVTANDIIAVLGPRIPNASSSQKDFVMGTIVVTRDRLLTDDELSFFDFFARRASETKPVDTHTGVVKRKEKPWNVATRGLSTIDPRLTFPKWLLFILNPPLITKVPPAGGPVKFNAQGLKLPLTVKVDGVPATRIRLRDAQTLTFMAPPHRRGTADIEIIQGRASAKLPNGLIYE